MPRTTKWTYAFGDVRRLYGNNTDGRRPKAAGRRPRISRGRGNRTTNHAFVLIGRSQGRKGRLIQSVQLQTVQILFGGEAEGPNRQCAERLRPPGKPKLLTCQGAVKRAANFILCKIRLVLCVAVCLSSAHAQTADETSIKAVFLFRFGAFVEWPESAFSSRSAPLTICVAGSDALAEGVRRAAAGQAINGRQISVRAGADHPDCNVLYAGGDEDEGIADALRRTRFQPILTVTDDNRGPLRGAIHFVIVDNRVRFYIDRDDADHKGLRLSSRLLGIALSTGLQDVGGPP